MTKKRSNILFFVNDRVYWAVAWQNIKNTYLKSIITFILWNWGRWNRVKNKKQIMGTCDYQFLNQSGSMQKSLLQKKEFLASEDRERFSVKLEEKFFIGEKP